LKNAPSGFNLPGGAFTFLKDTFFEKSIIKIYNNNFHSYGAGPGFAVLFYKSNAAGCFVRTE